MGTSKTVEAPLGADELPNYDFSRLSEREAEILAYAARGHVDKEIAKRLGLSCNTIRTYWSRIKEKCGFGSRSALSVCYAAHQSNLTRLTIVGFDPDWEVDLIEDRLYFISDRPHPQKYLHGAHVEESILTYAGEEQAKVRELFRRIRAGELDSFYLTGQFTTPEGPQQARGFCYVIRDENNRPIKLLGKRVEVADVSSTLDADPSL